MNDLINYIEKYLVNINTGSYVVDDFGEDYFDNAENIDQIKDLIEQYYLKFTKKEIDFNKLYEQIFNINVKWDTCPTNVDNFYPFKESFEKLGECVNGFGKDIIKEYLNI